MTFTTLPKSKWNARMIVSATLAVLALPPCALAAFGVGTGFFVTSDGYFLSCFHLVDGAGHVALKGVNGTIIDASVVAVDRSNNLAVLKANGRFPPLPMLDAAGLKLGTRVSTVGFSDPAAGTVTGKLKQSTVTRLSGDDGDPRWFRVGMVVQPGDCGAPFVTSEGDVVGIVMNKSFTQEPSSGSGAVGRNVSHGLKSSSALALLSGMAEARKTLAQPTRRRPLSGPDLMRITEAAMAVVIVDTNRFIEEEKALEREEAERLRRATEKQESQRAKSAREREAALVRHKEINRLQTTVSDLDWRESFLHQQVLSTEQQLSAMSRDTTDISTMARRGELERELKDLQTQLNQTTMSRQDAMRQLSRMQSR